MAPPLPVTPPSVSFLSSRAPVWCNLLRLKSAWSDWVWQCPTVTGFPYGENASGEHSVDTRLSFKVRLHQRAPSSRQEVACLAGYFQNARFSLLGNASRNIPNTFHHVSGGDHLMEDQAEANTFPVLNPTYEV